MQDDDFLKARREEVVGRLEVGAGQGITGVGGVGDGFEPGQGVVGHGAALHRVGYGDGVGVIAVVEL